MIDLVQVQKDLVGVLKAADLLSTVNVVNYREKRLAGELDYRTMLTTKRNGKAGAMVVVLMPTGASGHPNVSGPVVDWLFPVLSVEHDSINMGPEGTLLSAETIAQRVMDAVHLEADERLGTFRIVGQAMRPETEYVFPGCVGYRTTFGLTGKSAQTARCAAVTLSVETGVVALACSTAGSTIYYTLDGTHPSAASGATAYTAPFAVASGQELRAAAYATGYNKSATRYYLAP